VLGLEAPAYLPLRTFQDADLAPERAAQGDPVLGILAAIGALPAGWRAHRKAEAILAREWGGKKKAGAQRRRR